MKVLLTGTYRNVNYTKTPAELVSAPKQGQKGWFVQCELLKVPEYKGNTVRVTLAKKDPFLSADGKRKLTIEEIQAELGASAPGDASNPVNVLADNAAEDNPDESDMEVTKRIAQRFGVLGRMARGAANGNVRSLIVSGAPGVGKSFTVEQELEEMQTRGKGRFCAIKGNITGVQLYKKLYEFCDKNCVVLLDDCDTILFDETAINLLKAALDTGKKRYVSWMSNKLDDEGVPTSFEFKGSMIFITNVDFQYIVDQNKHRMAEHFKALLSRSLYLDLTLRTRRDLMCWIRHVVLEKEMLKAEGLDRIQSEEVLEFMFANMEKLRTISLREANKAAALYASDPKGWKELAKVVMLRK